MCILLLLATCWGVYVYRVKQPEVAVHFIDVGQGDAALLITPHGKAVMFDTGGTRGNVFDVGEKIDLPYLRHYGIRELSAIFLTHAHEDHAAGAGSLLRALPVERVFTAGEGRAVYEKSLSLSADENLSEKLTVANEGQTVTIDGVTITTVYAPTVTTSEAGNEASNVYRISYGNFSVLITGDIEAAGEEELVAAGKIAPCSVLKMAHHGSRTSNTEEFLRAAAPQAIIFCVGRDNSFGHPHAEVLARVKESGTKIYRTDEDGAVIFTSDGRTMRTETFYGSGRKQ